MADVVEFFLQSEPVESCQRQTKKQADAAVENEERFAESPLHVCGASTNHRRVGNAPVGCHRLSGPDRADFLRGVVTNRKDEIELRRIGLCEFVPGLAAETLGGYVSDF